MFSETHHIHLTAATYIDGVSITLGSPRKHVWTYAVGHRDDNNVHQQRRCPCAKHPGRDPLHL